MYTNEYTRPLEGRPYYRNAGLIKVYDRNNYRYSVGEIVFERYDEQNFQYIIRPYWDAIEQLPYGIFQGIPGINMDLRQKEYYRVNITPVFVSMRTPSESREDVRRLMANVGLDYYDRFEWLLRSETRCGDDNLLVVRKDLNSRVIRDVGSARALHLSPNDTIEINSLSDFNSSNANLVRDIYQILQSGAKIYIRNENRYLQREERSTMLYLLKNMLVSIERNVLTNRRQGRDRAKEEKRYAGRKPIAIDYQLLKQVAYEFENDLISEAEAMRRLAINSRSTFYRKLKTLRN